jgi:hypothetical protein
MTAANVPILFDSRMAALIAAMLPGCSCTQLTTETKLEGTQIGLRVRF